jgi:hypothetical protein
MNIVSHPQHEVGWSAAVVQKWVQRRSAPSITVFFGSVALGGGSIAAHRLSDAWSARVALLGSRVDLREAARFHAQKWRVDPRSADIARAAETPSA